MMKNFPLLASSIILFSISPLSAGEGKSFYLPPVERADSEIHTAARSSNDAILGAERLADTGWIVYRGDGEVQLTLLNGNSTLANEPAITFAYPWIGPLDPQELTLQVFNPSSQPNVARVTAQLRNGTSLSRDLGMKPLGGVEAPVPEGLVFLRVEGLRPVVSYLIYKAEGRTVWIDRGESTPMRSPEQGEELYALILEGTAAALQVEIHTTGPSSFPGGKSSSERLPTELSLERAPELADNVSMTWRTTDDRMTSVWVATDLRPFGTSVLGVLHTALAAIPQLISYVASDSDGKRVGVNLRLVRISQ